MTLQELLGDLFTDQVKEKIGDTQIFIFKKGEEIKLDAKEFVPKSRFNEVSEQVKEYKTQLDSTAEKLKELEKAAKGNDELNQKLTQLNEQITAERKESETKIEQFKKREMVLRNLVKDGAKDENMLITKLNLEAIKIDGDNLLGYTEQAETLKKSHQWAFGQESVNGVPPSGGNPPKPGVKNPFSKEHFNLTEQMRLRKTDPALADQLEQQAAK